MISFIHQPLYPGGKSSSTHWIGGWVGPRANLDMVVKRKDPCFCQKSNAHHPTHSLITILTELAW